VGVSARQLPRGKFALWILLGAVLTALLAATPVKGQVPQAAGAGAAPSEVVEVAPEPAAEAPEVAPVVEGSATAAPSPAPAPTPPPSSPASDAARAVSDVTAGVAAVTADAGTVAASEAGDRPASGLVARAGEETSRTLESTSEAAAAAPLPEKIAKPVAQVAKGVDRLSDEAQARAMDLVASAEKAVLPALPGQAPAGPAAPSDQSLPLHQHQAPVGKSLLAGAWVGLLPEAEKSVPATRTADTAAIDLLSVESPNGSIDLAGAQPLTILATAVGSVPHFNSPASPSGPVPLGSTTGLTTSGSGASFFVPIAALLALLALASPAILRRLRELPDFPAPTPFVCALERPG